MFGKTINILIVLCKSFPRSPVIEFRKSFAWNFDKSVHCFYLGFIIYVCLELLCFQVSSFWENGKKVLVLLDDSAAVLWSVNAVEVLHACSCLLFNERSPLFQQSVKNCLFKSSSFNEQSLSFLCQPWTSKDFSPLQISNWLSLSFRNECLSLYICILTELNLCSSVAKATLSE